MMNFYFSNEMTIKDKQIHIKIIEEYMRNEKKDKKYIENKLYQDIETFCTNPETSFFDVEKFNFFCKVILEPFFGELCLNFDIDLSLWHIQNNR
jgi:hypothetical protein